MLHCCDSQPSPPVADVSPPLPSPPAATTAAIAAWKVVTVASVALRQGAEQLMRYCVHFLSTHLRPVLELHGNGCLPSAVRARVSVVDR